MREKLFNELGQKWCTYCKKYHDVKEFYTNKNKPSGYQDHCKKAKKEMAYKYKNNKYETKLKEKVCKTCGRTLAIDNFARNNKTKDGFNVNCKECLNKKREYKYKILDDMDKNTIKIMFENNHDESYISDMLNIDKKIIYNYLVNIGYINENMCRVCGNDKNIIKRGKYKGYCKDCEELLIKKEKFFKEEKKKEEKEEKKKDKIKNEYIEKNKNNLIFCKKCNKEKNPYTDYYININKKGSIICECKECSKNKTEKNKLNNLKTKGYN